MSGPEQSFTHFGSGRGRGFLRLERAAPARGARRLLILALLRQWDRGLLFAHAHLHAARRCVDGEIPIAQTPDKVERLPHRLLARKTQRVLRHRRLDRTPDLRRRSEEAVRGRKSLERLVWPLEVVVLHEERCAPLAVVEVGEDRPRQKLVPHRLPEALDLAAGLWMMRTALHVRDPVSLELLLEGGRSAPSRILPPLVGEDLAWRTVVGDRARKRLHHKRALLVVRHHQAHEIARVVVHERRDIDTFLSTQQEREEIRLPQLVRLGPLEAARLALGLGLALRLAPRPESLVLEHPANCGLRSAQAEETSHHVADPPAARIGLRLLHRDHRLPSRIDLAHRRHASRDWSALRMQRIHAAGTIALRPVVHGRIWNPELGGHFIGRNLLVYHHRSGRQHRVERPFRTLPVTVYLPIPRLFDSRAHSVHSFRANMSSPIGGRVLSDF
jgi:hypothetical protein